MIQLVVVSQLLFVYLIILNNYNDNAAEVLVAALLHVNIAQVLPFSVFQSSLDQGTRGRVDSFVPLMAK
jgi:hypothetical protein